MAPITHVDKSGRPQKQVILLHLLRMDDTKVPPNIRIPEVRPFKLLILLVGQIGHRTLQLGYDGSRGKVACGQNTQFGFPSTM